MILQKTSQAVIATLGRTAMQAMAAVKFKRFNAQLKNASQVQRDWLLDRIARCRDTKFGRDHAYAEIRTLGDFRQRVPIGDYSRFASYIDSVAAGDTTALIPADEKLLRFTITTGSTGVPKLNPVTAVWLREYKHVWDLWGLKNFVDHPHQIGTRMLQMAGTWDMGRTSGGYQISMVSALLARYTSPFIRPFYSVPSDLNDIKDPVTRYYTALRLCILQRVGWIILMNPGTMIRLAQVGNEFAELLIRDIREGTLSDKFDVPQSLRERLAHKFSQKNPAGAARLQEIAQRTGTLLPKDYWNKPVIGCWIGGTAGFQIRYVPDYYGDCPMRDMGLVSSEGRHTIPLEDGKPEGVPAIGAGFYEFVPVEEIDAPAPTALEGHELQVGRDYYLVMTTAAGYARFHIGDIVRCTGFLHQAPLLEFVQKGTRVGDLEGEKVTEHQVLEAAHNAARTLGISLGNFTAVPNRLQNQHPRYDFLAEITDLPDPATARQFLEHLDQNLAALNFLWRARRKEGVLAPPHLWRLPARTWHKYLAEETARRGTGDYQFKHPGLVQDQAWLDQFQPVDIIMTSS
jgi:hypothetical protein